MLGSCRMAARPRRKHLRRHIALPNGDELWPRAEIANEELGINERSLRRLNPPTTYLSNVAYCPRNETLALLAKRIRRPNQPEKRKR